MKKMDEIELLKSLLFDKKTIYFFNFLVERINPFESIRNPYNFEDFDYWDTLIKNYEFKKSQNKNNFDERNLTKLFENFISNN